MLLPALAIVAGFVVLIWSAERFIEGAGATAKHLGMPPLLIGILVVGFGTSAPEMVVSAFAALDGRPNLALGNAYGSNIINISLVIGITALIAPITIHSKIIRKELPLLVALMLFSGWQLSDGLLSRADGIVLIIGFFLLLGWSAFSATRGGDDSLAREMDIELIAHPMPLKLAVFWLVLGSIALLISSRMLVWGAVSIADGLGVDELVIGLTIVALGTSLPELAASVAAILKNEHDIAIGNIIGSNMFNLLAVVGIAGVIHPAPITPEVLTRDWPVMLLLTMALFVMAYGRYGQGSIQRHQGGLLLSAFFAYNGWLYFSLS